MNRSISFSILPCCDRRDYFSSYSWESSSLYLVSYDCLRDSNSALFCSSSYADTVEYWLYLASRLSYACCSFLNYAYFISMCSCLSASNSLFIPSLSSLYYFTLPSMIPLNRSFSLYITSSYFSYWSIIPCFMLSFYCWIYFSYSSTCLYLSFRLWVILLYSDLNCYVVVFFFVDRLWIYLWLSFFIFDVMSSMSFFSFSSMKHVSSYFYFILSIISWFTVVYWSMKYDLFANSYFTWCSEGFCVFDIT